MQPAGAIRTFGAGSFVDAFFSPDGTKIYAASGGSVSVFNVASGTVSATYALGKQLGGMDLSPDGRYLAAVDLQLTGDPPMQLFYRLDLTTGRFETYQKDTFSGYVASFYDIAFLADGRALLSERLTTNTSILPQPFNFATEQFEPTGAVSGAPRPLTSSLTSYPDGSRVLIGQTDYFDAATFTIRNYAEGYDPYAGASVPSGSPVFVSAVSPSSSLFIQSFGLNIYDRSGQFIRSLSALYPELGGAEGLAFNSIGDKLYLYQPSDQHLYVLNTSDWSVIGGYAVPEDASAPFVSTFGDSLQVSPDGRYVTFNGRGGTLQVIDTTKAIMDGGTSGNDVLSGSGLVSGFGGDDDLTALAGPTGTGTTLYGGAGNDAYHITGANQRAIDLAADPGHDTVYSSVSSSFELGAGIEDLVLTGTAIFGTGNSLDNAIAGNDLDNILSGGSGNDTLIGNGGADTLYGGLGNDIMRGGAGDDSYYLDNSSDQVVEAANEGIDTVYAGGFSWTLGSNVENLVLQYGSANGTGNELANRIDATNASGATLNGLGGNDTLLGGAGSDILDGGTGDDRMSGGAGNDTYHVDSANDVVVEDIGSYYGGTDTVYANVNWTLGSNFENLVLRGTSAANGSGNELENAITGTELANTLLGLDGADVLIGNGGADVLDGGSDDDVLLGGAGADLLTGGNGNDVFRGTRAELAGDTITDFSSGDRIEVTDAAYYGFGFTRVGDSLTVGVGQSLTLSGNPVGRLVTSGPLDGPAQLSLANRMTGLSDFDGNGHSDILWRNTDGTFSTWGVSGNAQGNQFAVNATFDSSVDPTWRIQETFDWDGDGRSDILWRKGDGGEFSIWTGAGSGYGVNAYFQAGVGTNWQIAGVGDLNGDGKDDIVWREGNGAFSTWQSTGTGFNVNVDFDTSVSPDWQIVGLGDFDGDGKDDLLWRNQQNGAFSTWSSNGTGFTPNTNLVSSVDTTWHIDGIADFNGDGRDDILWRHDGDGTFTEWQSNTGGGFTVNAYVNGSVASVWQVSTTGDYNDDGRADILWRNTATGDFSIWQSNGGGFDPNTAYASGVGTNWQVQGHNFQFG